MTFEALGTHWWIELPDHNGLELIQNKILQIIKDFETDYSRFKPDSYIGKLNDQKVIKNPPDELVEMLNYALKMHEITNGVFNITVGSALENLGYGKESDKTSKVALSLKKNIHISSSLITISPGVRLDLGGFGKGWLIDKLAKYLDQIGIVNFVINGGGDIYVKSETPVTFILEHPFDKCLGMGEISLTRGALAASSSKKRIWEDKNGHTKHHIINPATSEPESHLASVHVLASTALIADTLGTVFLLANKPARDKLAELLLAPYLAISEKLTYYRTPNFPAEMYTNTA